MHFTECSVRGAWTIDPSPHIDDRGSFWRAWCVDEFSEHGIEFTPLQANIGVSHSAGTLRGLHYQVAPHAEAKLVRCSRGAVFDVLVDLRPGSETFGRWESAHLTSENGRMLFVPSGCAHGYQTLDDESEIYYLTSAVYHPASVRGLRFDDETVGIRWPMPPTAVSAQDLRWPTLRDHATAASR
jgi:dTDP-4-dehydrorhamnose 3,5-epimerase